MNRHTRLAGLLSAGLVVVLLALLAGCEPDSPYEEDPRGALADALAATLDGEHLAMTFRIDGQLDLAADPDTLEGEAERLEGLILDSELYIAGANGDVGDGPAARLREHDSELELRLDGSPAFAARAVDGEVFARVDTDRALDALGLGAAAPDDLTAELEMFLGPDVAGAVAEGRWLRLDGALDTLERTGTSEEAEREELGDLFETFYRENLIVEHLDSDDGTHVLRVSATVAELAAFTDRAFGTLPGAGGLSGLPGLPALPGSPGGPTDGSLTDDVPDEVAETEVSIDVGVENDAVTSVRAPIGEGLSDIGEAFVDAGEAQPEDVERLRDTGGDSLVLHVDVDADGSAVTAPDEATPFDLGGLFQGFPFAPGAGAEDGVEGADDGVEGEEHDASGDAEADPDGRASDGGVTEDATDGTEDATDGTDPTDGTDGPDEQAETDVEVLLTDAERLVQTADAEAALLERAVDDPSLWDELTTELGDFMPGTEFEVAETDGRVDQVELTEGEHTVCIDLDPDDPEGGSEIDEGACP
ncbi:hypothetical protein ER308_09195 [Egibacter rhizosphaerae]|uniref:Uncharacterized protein n=1 Tax=Egibacter rhizosphaerae TaxID=1670831 RepID=A0A411YEL8_9ACTN|nr:hypothetical protein [Egibacter rhizosphaerae]QBI19704.1 hypothetical protein ER308_09195 [Egibacter rhizosphaerae]